jgi:hypothetical protein
VSAHVSSLIGHHKIIATLPSLQGALSFIDTTDKLVYLLDELAQLPAISNGILGVEAVLRRPSSALASMHPATTIGHREVQARIASCAAMCAAAVLHGVSCHEGCPPPELTVPTTACPPAPTFTC